MLVLLLGAIVWACNFNSWLSQLGVYSAWNHGIYGSGVTVGVVDSGANVTVLKQVLGNDIDVDVISFSYIIHKDECLKVITIENKKYCVLENVTKEWGYEIKAVPITPTDDLGHGTAVTSIILSIAPRVKVIVVNAAVTIFRISYDKRIVGKEVLLDPLSVAEGIEYLYHRGVDIINLSLGVPFEEVYDIENILSQLESLNLSNVTVVASTGNEGIDTPSPISLENDVIAVGALDAYSPANFSNIGIGIDFVAPGTSLCLPVPSDSILALDNGVKRIGNVTWAYLSGTSFSTAMVSGLAALWIEASGAKGSSQVRCVMKKRVIDLGKKGWDPQTGYGMPLAPDGYYEPCNSPKYSFVPIPPLHSKFLRRRRRRGHNSH